MTNGIEVPMAARGGHVVLFYRDEEELADSVSKFLLPAVTDGDGTADAELPPLQEISDTTRHRSAATLAKCCHFS